MTSATVPQFAQYLISAANEMNSLLSRAQAFPEQGQDYLRQAAFLACNTHGLLLDDREFHDTIETLPGMRREHVTDFDAITGDFAHFELFLGIERQIMVVAGMNEALVDQMYNESRNLIEAVRNQSVEPQELLDAIHTIKDLVCELAPTLRQQPRNRGMARSARFLPRLTFGLGGAALVGLNSSALAATLGLSAAGTAVSAALGIAILGKAVIFPDDRNA